MRISDWSSDVCSSDLIRRFFFDERINRRVGKTLCAIVRFNVEFYEGDHDIEMSTTTPACSQLSALVLGRIRPHPAQAPIRRCSLWERPEKHRLISREAWILSHAPLTVFGRAHVSPPVTIEHFVCRPLPETK